MEAINKLNNTELRGRNIFLREDRESSKPPTDRREAGGHSAGGGNNRLYVGNLTWEVTWQDLKDYMRSAGGNVVSADVMTDSDGRSKGFGLVTFGSARDAAEAMRQLSETELKGRNIFIREDREGGGGAARGAENAHSNVGGRQRSGSNVSGGGGAAGS